MKLGNEMKLGNDTVLMRVLIRVFGGLEDSDCDVRQGRTTDTMSHARSYCRSSYHCFWGTYMTDWYALYTSYFL